MLSYFDLRKGTQFILEGEPYEILEFQQMQKAQDIVVAQTKIRNLITGKVFERNFHKRDVFEEAELEKTEAKFIYQHRGKFVFSESKNPANRFELTQEQIGTGAEFLKPGEFVTEIKFRGKTINVVLPIKIRLKVVESPPGLKGNRAQSGTKSVKLESGASINVPLFVEEGDVIEVNTQTGEYVKRAS
jgi:elongation factor P